MFAIESDVVKELTEKLRFANETISNLMDQNSKLIEDNSLEIGMGLSQNGQELEVHINDLEH